MTGGVRRRSLLLGGGLGALVSGGCAPHRKRDDTGGIVVASGNMSGVYYSYAHAWAAVTGADPRLRVLSTTGSVQNTLLLSIGTADIAFCAIDAAAQAVTNPQGPNRIAALGRLYDDYMHLVVLGGSPIRTISDLRGRRVCVGAVSSGTTLIGDRLLTVSGLDPDRDIVRSQLSLDQSVNALRAGTIDAFFWSGGLPTGAVETLCAQQVAAPVRLIDLAAATRKLRTSFGTWYRIGVIPGHTYTGITTAVSTLAVPNVLLTTAGRSTASASALTRSLFDDASRIGRTVPVADALNRHIAIFTQPVPLHPGAIAYYRSVAVDI